MLTVLSVWVLITVLSAIGLLLLLALDERQVRVLEAQRTPAQPERTPATAPAPAPAPVLALAEAA